MSALDIIDAVWQCVVILFVIVETVFAGFCCISVPLIWDKLDEIGGALRCIYSTLAAIHGDLSKPKKGRWCDDDEH